MASCRKAYLHSSSKPFIAVLNKADTKPAPALTTTHPRGVENPPGEYKINWRVVIKAAMATAVDMTDTGLATWLHRSSGEY